MVSTLFSGMSSLFPLVVWGFISFFPLCISLLHGFLLLIAFIFLLPEFPYFGTTEGKQLSSGGVRDVEEEEEGGEEGEDSGGQKTQSAFTSTNRDEYGQSILHFAAARTHGRNGMFQLIQESGINVGYRDELYRTARDVALQANLPNNIHDIDKYVLGLAAVGETEKIIELVLEGYDHILDLEDDEDNNIIDLVTKKQQQKTLDFVSTITDFEEKKSSLHQYIREGDLQGVKRYLEDGGVESKRLAVAKNTTARCSLHIAVLCQHEQVAGYIAHKYPETLQLGDNLDRTPLHYAMGVESVEQLSHVLIQYGAQRVVKDLKGRQPTYYFMNRSEINRLQEEEDLMKV